MAVMAGEICDFSLFFFTKIDRQTSMFKLERYHSFLLVRFLVNFWCTA